MSVRTGEFIFRLLTEREVPDDPVPHEQAELIGDNFDVRGVFITDGDIKRAMWFEDLFTYAHPFFCPGDVVFLFELVVVFIVLITDIKRRIGENQVCERLADLSQQFDAIAANYPIEIFLHGDMIHRII